MLFGFHLNYISWMANLLLYINIINIMYLHFVFSCNLSYTNLTRYTVIYIYLGTVRRYMYRYICKSYIYLFLFRVPDSVFNATSNVSSIPFSWWRQGFSHIYSFCSWQIYRYIRNIICNISIFI